MTRTADPTATDPSSAAAVETVDGPVPDVTGDFGAKPTVATSAETPSDQLAVKVLKEGDGEVVRGGDLLVAHYLGQVWASGAVFDNSYDRGEPTAFQIGTGAVIQGWDAGLVGQSVGSRVELAIPPALGYPDGNEQAGITKEDTLVFVVDIVDTYGATEQVENTPVAQVPAGLPTVTDGEAGEGPTVEIGDSAAPTASDATVLADGTGAPLATDKNLVLHLVRYDYEGNELGRTWGQMPDAYKATEIPQQIIQALTGKAAGTRVLFRMAPAEGGTAEVFVVDTLGSF